MPPFLLHTNGWASWDVSVAMADFSVVRPLSVHRGRTPPLYASHLVPARITQASPGLSIASWWETARHLAKPTPCMRVFHACLPNLAQVRGQRASSRLNVSHDRDCDCVVASRNAELTLLARSSLCSLSLSPTALISIYAYTPLTQRRRPSRHCRIAPSRPSHKPSCSHFRHTLLRRRPHHCLHLMPLHDS